MPTVRKVTAPATESSATPSGAQQSPSGAQETTAQVSITKPCGRCGGSGRYSFNLMDGDRCYGCGGLGCVIDTRAAKKAGISVKATATLQTCRVGDVIVRSKIPYTVIAIEWCAMGTGTYSPGSDRYWANQVVRAHCPVNGKKYRMWRTVYDTETRMGIHPAPELLGTEANPETHPWADSGTGCRVER